MGLEVSNRTQNIEERSMSNSRLKGIVLDYINKVDSYEGRTLELETMKVADIIERNQEVAIAMAVELFWALQQTMRRLKNMDISSPIMAVSYLYGKAIGALKLRICLNKTVVTDANCKLISVLFNNKSEKINSKEELQGKVDNYLLSLVMKGN